MNSFAIGTAVKVKDKPGVVRFVGKTQFAPGTWVGVELDQPVGKNDGSINGVRYFSCSKPGNYGLFALPTIVETQKESSTPKEVLTKESVIIDRLQGKLHDAVKDIRNYKDQITQLKLKIGQYNDIESTLDQISVDRDFLQLENSRLQEQLVELQEKYNAVHQELMAVKEELELNRELEDEIRLAGSESDDITTLSQKNKKLEIYLSNVKDVSRVKELELTEEIEKLKVSVENGINPKDYDELLKKLNVAETTIVDLKGQLESMMDLASIIDRLTTENELLNLQITQLKTQVDELVELQELDTNLEAHHAQIEQDLRDKIVLLELNLKQVQHELDEMTRKQAELKKNVVESNVSSTFSNSVPSLARNSSIQNTNEVKLSLDLAARTRELAHTKLLYTIAQHQLKVLPSSYQINSCLPVAALQPIYDHIVNHGLCRHIAVELQLLIQTTLYIEVSDSSLMNELQSLSNSLLTYIENQNLESFLADQIQECIISGMKLVNNRVFNRICIDYIVCECNHMESIINSVSELLNQEEHSKIIETINKTRSKAALKAENDLVNKPDILGHYDITINSILFEFDKQNNETELDLSLIYTKLTHFYNELDKQFMDEPMKESKKEQQLQIEDKEQMIKDLQFTIELLENNMSNLTSSNRQKLDLVQEQLKEVQSKYNDLKTDYESLKAENRLLEQELEELMDSGKYYDVSYLKGRFGDIKGEQTFVDNIKLLEEIQYLRKFIGKSHKSSLDWLHTPSSTTIPFSDPFLGVSHRLQKIARSAEILPITKGKWTKREKNPKLVVSTIKYEVSRVNSEMNKILQDNYNKLDVQNV